MWPESQQFKLGATLQKFHLKFSLIRKHFSQRQQARKNRLLFKSEVVWIKSQSGISRSRRCLPFLLSVFVTNFNNIWHSINFSWYNFSSRTRARACISPLQMRWKCHESCRGGMDWRLAGNEVYKWLPCFPRSFAQIEKNKSITWAAASLLLSFHSLPAADLFANMHFPCVTDTQNNL